MSTSVRIPEHCKQPHNWLILSLCVYPLTMIVPYDYDFIRSTQQTFGYVKVKQLHSIVIKYVIIFAIKTQLLAGQLLLTIKRNFLLFLNSCVSLLVKNGWK